MRVKIFCHSCGGKGTVKEKKYPDGEEIDVVCPECNGDKWVWSE
jgi:DnaJ-class molecular chaperone